jgi:hypothetical protein
MDIIRKDKNHIIYNANNEHISENNGPNEGAIQPTQTIVVTHNDIVSLTKLPLLIHIAIEIIKEISNRNEEANKREVRVTPRND